jgi:hypothetical protein
MLRGSFWLGLSRVTTEGDFASRAKSIGLGARWSSLGDVVGLGLGGASAVLRLGVALMREVFWGLGAFAGLGEPLVPLRLGCLGGGG